MKKIYIVLAIAFFTLSLNAQDTYFMNLDNVKYKLDNSNKFKRVTTNKVKFINLDKKEFVSFDNALTWEFISDYKVKNYFCENHNSLITLLDELNINKNDLQIINENIYPFKKNAYKYKSTFSKTKGIIIFK